MRERTVSDKLFILLTSIVTVPYILWCIIWQGVGGDELWKKMTEDNSPPASWDYCVVTVETDASRVGKSDPDYVFQAKMHDNSKAAVAIQESRWPWEPVHTVEGLMDRDVTIEVHKSGLIVQRLAAAKTYGENGSAIILEPEVKYLGLIAVLKGPLTSNSIDIWRREQGFDKSGEKIYTQDYVFNEDGRGAFWKLPPEAVKFFSKLAKPWKAD